MSEMSKSRVELGEKEYTSFRQKSGNNQLDPIIDQIDPELIQLLTYTLSMNPTGEITFVYPQMLPWKI